MRRKGRLAVLSAALLLALSACGNDGGNAGGEPVALTISAAASLTDALTEIRKTYEGEHEGVKLSFNFGASGALQQQIEQGAPADLFLSAAAKNMNALVGKKLIEDDAHTNLLTNALVVVTPKDGQAVASLADLSGDAFKQIAIGIPESVPAGGYAKEALENAGLWDSLAGKTVQGKDVRQVLQYVETGNVDAGFVYKTDALTSKDVTVALEVDPSTYEPIAYPIGIVKATKHEKEARAFYDYLQSKDAKDVFAKYGFTMPD